MLEKIWEKENSHPRFVRSQTNAAHLEIDMEDYWNTKKWIYFTTQPRHSLVYA